MSHSLALSLTDALLEPPGNLPPGHLERINALQNKRGKTALAESDIIVRPIRLTGDQLSCLYTRFPPDELASMATQINEAAGPLLSAHITDDRPIGSFYAAEVTEEEGNLWLDTFAYWLADEEGNKLARDIDAGILNEASIGWSWETAECSICGQDYRDWEACPHWPGETFQVVINEQTRETEERLCFLWMIGCTFDEGSLVYRGGHPDTKVGGTLKHEFVPLLGALSPGEQAPHLTHFQLEATRDAVSLHQKAKPKKEKLGKPAPGDGAQPEPPPEAAAPEGETVKLKLKKPNGKTVTVELESDEQLQTLFDEGFTLGKQDGETQHRELVAEALGLEPADLETSTDRLAQLAAQAKDGNAYRKDLEARLSAAAVQVEGQGDKATRITKLGKKADIDDLKGLVEDWEHKVLSLPNDRQSQDPDEGGAKPSQAALRVDAV